MGDPAVFAKYSSEELEAIQWDSLEEELSRAAQYNVIKDYEALNAIYTAAKRR